MGIVQTHIVKNKVCKGKQTSNNCQKNKNSLKVICNLENKNELKVTQSHLGSMLAE